MREFLSHLGMELVRRVAHSFIVSFPKSGRTWVRVFLAHYASRVYGREVKPFFTSLREYLAGIPRIVFTHAGAEGEGGTSKKLTGRRVLFIARDPRDIVVSYYFQITKREAVSAAPGDLSEFIRDPKYGLERIISFMNEWSEARETFKSFLCIRYEDLKQSPKEEFAKIISFVGFPWDEKACEEALEYARFENMQERERKGGGESGILKATNTADADSYKVRRGKVGGYADYFSVEDTTYVEQALRKLDAAFKYR